MGDLWYGAGWAGEARTMSVKVMSWVWENSQQEGGSLLVLLAMADFARDDGTCWPSVSTLAKKARLTDRQIFRVLADLRRAGEIETVKLGGGRGHTATYRVTMGNPAKKSGIKETLTSEPETLTFATLNPDTGVTNGAPYQLYEPLIEPSENHHTPEPAVAGRKFKTGFPSQLTLTEEHRQFAAECGIRVPDNFFEMWKSECLSYGSKSENWWEAYKARCRRAKNTSYQTKAQATMDRAKRWAERSLNK